MSEPYRYAIRWFLNVVRLGKRGKRSVCLGFCGKTKKVAFIAVVNPNRFTMEAAKPIIVRDLYATDVCEDEKWCWNLKCSLNRATPETLRKYLGKKGSQQDMKKLSAKLQEIGQHLLSVHEIDWTKELTTTFEKPPYTIFSERSERRKEGQTGSDAQK